jgi:hypothetical protein
MQRLFDKDSGAGTQQLNNISDVNISDVTKQRKFNMAGRADVAQLGCCSMRTIDTGLVLEQLHSALIIVHVCYLDCHLPPIDPAPAQGDT